MIDRRKNGRRMEDQPKRLLASRTVLCSWIGILASMAGVMLPGWCEMALLLTMLSAFGTFLFRLMATRSIG